MGAVLVFHNTPRRVIGNPLTVIHIRFIVDFCRSHTRFIVDFFHGGNQPPISALYFPGSTMDPGRDSGKAGMCVSTRYRWNATRCRKEKAMRDAMTMNMNIRDPELES
jgi:hypothetical protein